MMLLYFFGVGGLGMDLEWKGFSIDVFWVGYFEWWSWEEGLVWGFDEGLGVRYVVGESVGREMVW